MFPQYECKSCIQQKRQSERGCEKDHFLPFWNDLDGEPRTRCPRRPIFEDPLWYNYLIEAYNAYKGGFLPHAGGMMDQAALFPFIMGTIDDVMAKCDDVERQRAAKKNQTPGESVIDRGRHT